MDETFYSFAGGAGFAIAVAGFLVRWLTKLVENHLQHLTDAVREMRDDVHALVDELRRRV